MQHKIIQFKVGLQQIFVLLEEVLVFDIVLIFIKHALKPNV